MPGGWGGVGGAGGAGGTSSRPTHTCALDGCSRPVYVDARTGVRHDYCGRTHAAAAGALRHTGGSERKRGAPDDVIVLDDGDGKDDEDAAFQLQLAEVQAESKRQAERDEERRRKEAKARRREEQHLQVAILQTRQVQEQEDFNLALNVGRPPGPWFPDSARRSECGLPGCVQKPLVAHQGFCCADHYDRAVSRGLMAPPSDEVERCFVGPSGDFSCLLLTQKSQKRADIVEQFRKAWRKHGQPRVEHVYEIVPPPQVRERFDRYATSVGNTRRRFHGTSSTCAFGTSLAASPCAAASCCLCSILSSGFLLGKAGTGPNSSVRRLRYGPGIYFSATSGKSNDYAGNSERHLPGAKAGEVRKWRVMLLANVAVGRAFTTQEEELRVPEDIARFPPAGYHSIVAEPGQGLNFDELVVFEEAAAVPENLIVYSL